MPALARLLPLLLLAVAPAAPPSPPAPAPGAPDPLTAAEERLKAGRFADAAPLYAQVLAQRPEDFVATERTGTLALLANRLEEAERWLEKARALQPGDRTVIQLLAEAYRRGDDFARAAPLFRALDKEPIAKQLESFKGLVPYGISGGSGVSRIKFLQTDPLPLLAVRVNGGQEVDFLIDTGASEVYLDTDFALKVGAARFGATTGTFGGGQQAATEHGRIASLQLGDVVVKDLPVLILPTRRFAAVARGREVSGILGTTLLSHFLATLDYPGGELVLRPKGPEPSRAVAAEAKAQGGIEVPFWMAGDHYMVAWGRVEKSGPLLFFADTGLAGGGFVPTESTLQEAGIQLPAGVSAEGVGGGGTVKIVPFKVGLLSLGDATERDLTGIFGPFPQALEWSAGFRIGGIISHQFFRPYALTFDFTGMKLYLVKKAP